MPEQLTSLALSWGFPVLISALVASGLGLPVPENIPLLLTGWLCETKGIQVWSWAGYCFLIVMSRDAMVYAAGRYIPSGISSSRWFGRIFSEQRQVKIRRHFDHHGWRTVFLARFLPGFRVVVFFVAGRSGLSTKSFLLANGLAGIISIPPLVVLGYVFSQQLSTLKQHVDVVQTVIFISVVAYFSAIFIRQWRRHRRSSDD